MKVPKLMTIKNEINRCSHLMYDEDANGDKITDFLYNIYLIFSSFIDLKVLTKSYYNFLVSIDLNFQNNHLFLSYYQIKKYLSNKLSELIKNKDYYYIPKLYLEVIQNILNQETIRTNFEKKLVKIDPKYKNNPNKLCEIADIVKKDDTDSVMKLCFNLDCNFFIEKNYENMDENIKRNELKILFNTNGLISSKAEEDEYLRQYPSFIIQSVDTSQDLSNVKKVSIPYFPYQNLGYFLELLNKNNSDENLFTFSDKMVMIKEISLALYHLQLCGKIHGNLCDNSIFINEAKDVYIGGFSHNRDNEASATSTHLNIFYRCNNDNMNEDIYSFGVLVNEIMTTISPESLLRAFDKQNTERIINSNYIEFLFGISKDFHDKLKGIKRCISEEGLKRFKLFHNNNENEVFKCIKELIERCMTRRNGKEQFSSFKEIIEFFDSKILPKIDSKIQNEIEYRIKRATSAEKYRCSLAKIVYNYYFQNNESSEKIIYDFFAKIKIFLSEEDCEKIIFNDDDDIIYSLLNFFEFENKPLKFELEDEYNSIIHSCIFEMKNQIVVDHEDGMFELSTKCFGNNLNLIPITTLGHFMIFLKDEILKKKFIYIISTEIGHIHSNMMFHGEISMNSIGVYYDCKNNSFAPSLIAFYYFYRIKNKKCERKSKSKLLYQTEDDILLYKQKKDIKAFFDIIKDIHLDTYEYISTIDHQNSMSIISFALFNLYKDDRIAKEYQNAQIYSNLNLTFQTLHTLLNSFSEDDEISNIFKCFLIEDKNHSFFDVENALHQIINTLFSNEEEEIEIQSNQVNSKANDSNLDDDSIYELERKMKLSKISLLFDKISKFDLNVMKHVKWDENTTSNKINDNYDDDYPINPVYDNFVLSFYSTQTLHQMDEKVDNMIKRPVERKVVMPYIAQSSLVFLFTRYFKCLDPEKNYRIVIKLQSNKSKADHNEAAIKAITELAERDGCTVERESKFLIILKISVK